MSTINSWHLYDIFWGGGGELKLQLFQYRDVNLFRKQEKELII